MKIDRQHLTDLLVSLGVTDAPKWDTLTLEQKVNHGDGIVRYLDPGEVVLPSFRSLFDSLVLCQEKGGRIVPIGELTPPQPKPKSREGGPEAWKERLEGWKKRPAKLRSWDSITGVTVRLLVDAGKKDKPITRDQILAVLCKKFPDRDAEKMSRTLYNLIPTQLEQYRGLSVLRGEDADGHRTYYIPKGTEIPEATPRKRGRQGACA